ncbi:hypothetical protein [Acinetobacter baumannii]|uniref:hypothetical protein n=2 Tax=Acinetobacter TaxID=469 RepID=UPI0012982EAA|nr:hypothetical protein [Acinetobacter baumannii]
MKKIILGSMLAAAFPASFSHALAPKNGDKPTYCEQIVSVHGLLSRAQFECGYSE